MTDNEIINALECCKEQEDCDNCPMYDGTEDCCPLNNDMVLNLINRQKAEIERLKERNNELNQLNKTTAIEAVKDFADLVKEGEVYMRIDFPNTKCGTETFVVLSEDIDNLVKEMEGKEDA